MAFIIQGLIGQEPCLKRKNDTDNQSPNKKQKINQVDLDVLPIDIQVQIVSYLPKKVALLSISKYWTTVESPCLTTNPDMREAFASRILSRHLKTTEPIPTDLIKKIETMVVSSLHLSGEYPEWTPYYNVTPDYLESPENLLFSSVKKLNCSEFPLNIFNIDFIGKFRNLESLDISLTQDSTIEHFGGTFPSSLKTLHCRDSALKDKILLKILTECPHLTELDISGSPDFRAPTLDFFPKSLKILDLSNCQMGDRGISTIFKICPNLTELNISENRYLSGSTFNLLPRSIQVLTCNSCYLTNDNLKPLSKLPDLKKLDISKNRNINGSTFDFLPNSLEVLICDNCSLTDEAIKPHVGKLSILKELSIEGNKITDLFFAHFLYV